MGRSSLASIALAASASLLGGCHTLAEYPDQPAITTGGTAQALIIAAVGRLKDRAERELLERYRDRFGAMAKRLGFNPVAWLAFRAARWPADRSRTYGFERLQVLAAFGNAVTLFILAFLIVLEALRRLAEPEPVLGGTMLRGGRGTFIGTLFGTGLIVQIINGATFLRLTQAGELFYQGVLIVAAAVIYSQIRRRRVLG